MDADERAIFEYLKTWGSDFVGAREVCRRAGNKRKFHEDPEWAKPLLNNMEERGILESNAQGKYRIKPSSEEEEGHHPASPEGAKTVDENGVATNLSSDEHYDQL